MSNADRAYSWDEPPIDNPTENGNFVLLPVGKYPFTVTKFERGWHDGSEKLPSCNKAMITCSVYGGQLGDVELKTNLFLHSKCEGLLAAFFTSLGLRKHGDPLVFVWNRVVGSTGFCEVGIRKGTGKYEGKDFNEIKRFLEPDANGNNGELPEPEIPF